MLFICKGRKHKWNAYLNIIKCKKSFYKLLLKQDQTPVLKVIVEIHDLNLT